MKNLLIAAIISGTIFILGCEKENPVSPLRNITKNSLQKRNYRKIPDPLTEPIYTSFQTSGHYLNILKFSILELNGNATIGEIGYCKIISFTIITSNTQTGKINITTDKGDEIVGTLSGTVRADTGNVLYFSGKFKLMHGTKNFTGITGNGDYFGNISKNGINGKLVLDGVMYLPEIIRVDRNIQNKFQHDKFVKVRLEK